MKLFAAGASLSFALFLLGHALLTPLQAGKKKHLDDGTEILNAPQEPPASLTAETRRLVFRVSPLGSKGLLSQQTRDAIRAIWKDNEGLQIVKVRAFVAGAGDLRRVPQIVSESFTEKKHLQLPVVSVVQAGGLPLAGAQVVLETISVAKRDVNPLGLLFLAAREHSVAQPLQPLLPLAEASLDDLTKALAGHGEPLRVTCFVTMLDDAPRLSAAISARFPAAAVNVVQTQRASSRTAAACEAVARATAPAGSANYVNSERLVLTGLQTAYGFREEDARLAFSRLDKELASHGASLKTAASLDAYALSASIAAQVNRLEPAFLDPARPPTAATLVWEGLPGMDASFAVEAAAPAQ